MLTQQALIAGRLSRTFLDAVFDDPQLWGHNFRDALCVWLAA